MKKIPLMIKEEYLCYCANHMMNVINDGMFFLLADLRAILINGVYVPSDLIQIDVDPDVLLTLHAQLGERQEVMTSGIHQRLKESLLPQLIAMISVDPEDPETDLELLQSAGYVLTQLQAREISIDNWVQEQITSGRNRITA